MGLVVPGVFLVAQAPFRVVVWGFRIVPRRSVKPGMIFVGIRCDLVECGCWSTGVGWKAEMVPGGGNDFSVAREVAGWPLISGF